MSETWRLVDTGLASPARNIALDRALLEARAAEEIGSTLRFARSTRCVLLAAGDSAAQALDVDYCRDRPDMVQQRRLTNGAAFYADERQLLWALYLHRRETDGATLHALGRRICHAAAAAIGALGVDARLRDRAQIEIDGRAIGEGGFAVEGDAVLFQGVLRLELEPAEVLAPLRTPWSGDGAALAREAAKRVGSIAGALGRTADVRTLKTYLAEAFESAFGVEFRDADLGLSEHARCTAAMPAIDTREWLTHTAGDTIEAPLAAAGEVCAAVLFDRTTLDVRRVWFTRGLSLKPARGLPDLEAALAQVPLARVAQRIEWFFGSRSLDAGGYTPADLAAVIERAVRRPLLTDRI